jgi:hypothetical protein
MFAGRYKYTQQHHDIAASIDKEVGAFPDTAGGME